MSQQQNLKTPDAIDNEIFGMFLSKIVEDAGGRIELSAATFTGMCELAIEYNVGENKYILTTSPVVVQ